jgi:hypothetical protein
LFGFLSRRSGGGALSSEDFLARVPRDGRVLEIGRFVSPKLTGENIRYFDVLDRAGLDARAAKKGLAPGAPEIHYVSASGDLSAVGDRFAALFGAHVLEHQPDLIAHPRQAEALLEPDGRYFLVIPDKRYCFDHFLPESTVAEVIDAHLRPSPVHTARSVLSHHALTTHNSPARHWTGDHGDLDDRVPRLRQAMAALARKPGRQLDVHAWQFTPASFRALIGDLRALELTGLGAAEVWETPRGRGEFCAVLGRSQPVRL